MIRLILVCVQDSLIIQKSYNASLMIHFLSYVPVFRYTYIVVFKLCFNVLGRVVNSEEAKVPGGVIGCAVAAVVVFVLFAVGCSLR